MDIIVTLSDAEHKALASIAVSPEEWVNNVVKERCRITINEIVKNEVERLLAAGEVVSGSKEDIVMAAPIESLAEVQARLDATNT